MTIEQLVEELKTPRLINAKDKKIEILKKHLKTDYMSYEAKLDLCKNILLKSSFVEVNGKDVYKPNSPLKYELTILCYLQAYYDFELNNQFLDDFNLLEKNMITELLIEAIGYDANRFVTVLGMMEDDLAYDNSLVPYLSTKLDAIDIVLSAMNQAVEKKGITISNGRSEEK